MPTKTDDRMPASLWAATADPPPDLSPLSGDGRADVAIIGAGFTGLSAAIHLAERGIKAVVLDAREPGWGASGRNGGQTNPGLKLTRAELQARFGEALGARMYAIASGAPQFVFDLSARLGIDCEANRAGTLRLAHHQRAFDALKGAAATLAGEGITVRILDRAETAREVGSDIYVGGLFDPRGGNLHPLKFARGLAKAAIAKGATLHPRSEVVALKRNGSAWELRTASARLTADRVVLATNGYTDALWPGLAQTLLPVHSFQISTAPLSDNIVRSILPSRPSAYDSRRLVLYFRVTGDNRVILGGRASHSVADRPTDYAVLRRVLVGLFPSLADAAIDYGWAGRVAITMDHLPHVHELAPGLIAALGYNGRGVAMATRMGKVIADQVADGRQEEFAITPPRPIPFHWLRAPALHAVMQYHRVMDALGR